PGLHRISAAAHDLDQNSAMAQDVMVDVKAVGQSPGDLGASCSKDADCNGGGVCAAGSCTHSCGTATTSCAAGFNCGSVNGLRLCVRTDDGGCSVGGHTSGAEVWVLFLLLALSHRRRLC